MATSVREQLGMGAGSLEKVRSALGVARPASLRALLSTVNEPIELDEELVTGTALRGHHSLRLTRDGTSRHVGHVRATGFPSFQYSIRTMVVPAGAHPPVVVVAANGRVHGTNEGGDREHTWDETAASSALALNWLDFKGARFRTEFTRDADWFGDAGSALMSIAELASGAALSGPPGVLLVLGVNALDGLSDEIGVGGLIGVRLAAGTILLFGPGVVYPAVVAGAAVGTVIEAALEHRRMDEHEVQFADAVFQSTLPLDRIVLTNMIGLGGRPFTVPSVGNQILVNLGDGFTAPTTYPGFGSGSATQAPGQVFIHELTHAWQIEHSTFLPGVMCRALLDQATTVGGDMGVYQYGPAGRAWSAFNLEQQASIVDEWFAGGGRQHMFRPMTNDDTNPYFRYIRDNIRATIT